MTSGASAKIKKKEQCTWSLVTDDPDKKLNQVVIGAGHCVDHWSVYSSDKHPNTKRGFNIGENKITWTSNSGQVIKRQLAEIIRAELHSADFAIALLNQPIASSDLQALLLAPYSYSDLLLDFDPAAFGTMAGYSADTGIGQNGKLLSYDKCARVNGGTSGKKKAYCHSYGGASGGPLTVTLNTGVFSEEINEIWEEEGGDPFVDFFQDDFPTIKKGLQTFYVGSIVGGHASEDNGKTLFTPIEYYSKTIYGLLEGRPEKCLENDARKTEDCPW